MDWRINVMGVLVAVVAIVLVLRLIVGVVKLSGKILVWGLLCLGILGGGYLWLSGDVPGVAPPPLSIPGER